MTDTASTEPRRRRSIELTETRPVYGDEEIEAVVDVLRRGNLALGERVTTFEARVAELLAKRHGVMVNSGTSALWLAVDLLGCAPGDEVITSPLTFSSDIAPLVRNGIVPAFVDVEADTLQIDVAQIEADDRAEDQGHPRAEPGGQLSRLGRHPRHSRRAPSARRRRQL